MNKYAIYKPRYTRRSKQGVNALGIPFDEFDVHLEPVSIIPAWSVEEALDIAKRLGHFSPIVAPTTLQ